MLFSFSHSTREKGGPCWLWVNILIGDKGLKFVIRYNRIFTFFTKTVKRHKKIKEAKV